MALISPYTNQPFIVPIRQTSIVSWDHPSQWRQGCRKGYNKKIQVSFDSNICIGVFSQFQLHTRYCTKITLKSPNPRETSERMNFNVIDKKQLTWKLFIFWYLMSFFHKKMSQNLWATIMPFGPVTNILLAQKKFFGPAEGWPHFRHWEWISHSKYHIKGEAWDVRCAEKSI
jgi:hypothetical protein